MDVRTESLCNKTIVYLAYGGEHYIREALFSILSAIYFVPLGGHSIRYVVYTDRPERFEWLTGIEIVHISSVLLDSWMGSNKYIHRRKTMAIIDASRRYHGKIIFLDTDTCFQNSPNILFDRVRPGKTCMHLLENSIDLTGDQESAALTRMIATQANALESLGYAGLSEKTNMWNSGVVAFDQSDAHLMPKALDLIDFAWKHSLANNAEQFATGVVFENYSRLQSSRDIIFHYWPGFLKRPFRAYLETSLPLLETLPLSDAANEVHSARPRATKLQSFKQNMKLTMRVLGIRSKGYLRSA